MRLGQQTRALLSHQEQTTITGVNRANCYYSRNQNHPFDITQMDIYNYAHITFYVVFSILRLGGLYNVWMSKLMVNPLYSLLAFYGAICTLCSRHKRIPQFLSSFRISAFLKLPVSLQELFSFHLRVTNHVEKLPVRQSNGQAAPPRSASWT